MPPAAATKATDKTVDAAAMFQALLNDVTYSGGATEFEASETNVAMILGGTLPEGTEAYLAANSSSYLRCAVFACKDKDAAAAVKKLIQTYIDDSIDAKYKWMKWRCCRMPRSTAWATM